MKRSACGLGAAAVVYWFYLAHAPGAIVYHSEIEVPPGPGVYFPPDIIGGFGNIETKEIDVDGNGTIDLEIVPEGLATNLSARGGSLIFGRDYPPPSNDFGYFVTPLSRGEEVGPFLPERYGPLAGFYNDEEFRGSGLLAGGGGFGGASAPIGDFALIRAFAGFQFKIDDRSHYGWIDLGNLFIGNGAGIAAYGWAYESEPNTSIVAGAVPEPGSGLLLLTFAGTLFGLRQRNALRRGVVSHGRVS
ncbi:MAG: hypothetical protein ABI680_08015 [Chthoniobacteraceae bacterium]